MDTISQWKTPLWRNEGALFCPHHRKRLCLGYSPDRFPNSLALDSGEGFLEENRELNNCQSSFQRQKSPMLLSMQTFLCGGHFLWPRPHPSQSLSPLEPPSSGDQKWSPSSPGSWHHWTSRKHWASWGSSLWCIVDSYQNLSPPGCYQPCPSRRAPTLFKTNTKRFHSNKQCLSGKKQAQGPVECGSQLVESQERLSFSSSHGPNALYKSNVSPLSIMSNKRHLNCVSCKTNSQHFVYNYIEFT